MRNPKFVAKAGRGTEADVEEPWLSGSRIRHSTLRQGKPVTRLCPASAAQAWGRT
ncbi:hypothetical protein ACFL1Z_09425 [Thermodesulfobacteriota bacterium]